MKYHWDEIGKKDTETLVPPQKKANKKGTSVECSRLNEKLKRIT